MSTADIQFAPPIHPKWTSFGRGKAFQCHVILWPEDSGFSAHCVNLPGVVSQGETEAEALDNIMEAFRETLAYYRDSEEQIPWTTAAIDRPQGYLERWLEVRI